MHIRRSVGREGDSPPYWYAEYAKYNVFSSFQTNFRSESKNTPHIGIDNENATTLTLDLKRIRSQKLIPAWSKTFLGESSPNFGHEIVPIPSKNRFVCFRPPKQPLPPIANFVLRPCVFGLRDGRLKLF